MSLRLVFSELSWILCPLVLNQARTLEWLAVIQSRLSCTGISTSSPEQTFLFFHGYQVQQRGNRNFVRTGGINGWPRIFSEKKLTNKRIPPRANLL
jgi:hypothetical protein